MTLKTVGGQRRKGSEICESRERKEKYGEEEKKEEDEDKEFSMV